VTLVVRHATATSIAVYPFAEAGDGQRFGVVSSATATVRGPSDGEPVAATPTIDPLSGTVSVEALEGDTELTLSASASYVQGRRYLLTTEEGSTVVEAAFTGTGASITLASPLPMAAQVGATLRGIAVLVPLTEAQTTMLDSSTVASAPPPVRARVTDVGRFGLVEVRCLVDGIAQAFSEAYRIARRMARVPLSAAELVQDYPSIRSMRAAIDRGYSQLIDAAWTNLVLPRVLVRGKWPEDILDTTVLRAALGNAVMLHAVRQERQVDADFVDRWQTAFDLEIDRAVARIDWHEDPYHSVNPSPTPDPSQRSFGGRTLR
jgi:hypothetical protein